MEDGGNVVVEIAVREPREEFVLIEIFRDLAVDEVRELAAALQVVDGEDRRFAAPVERADEIGADEARGAGDDGVHVESSPSSTARDRRGRYWS